jgi:hypothetical protein
MLADLVEQQTTTTGTGAYTVSGSVSYRRTFATALATGNVIPYICVASDGTFECGYGTWDETAGTLARTEVTSSSNSNLTVNWSAGTKKIYLGAHSGSWGGIRHNFAAGAAPTVNDDSADGYTVGSLWMHFGGLYICYSSSLGAAVWRPVLYAVPQANGTQEYRHINGYFSDRAANSTVTPNGYHFNAGYSSAVSNAYADGGLVGLAAFTTNATATKMAHNGNHATNSGIYCEAGSVTTITGVVTAINNSTKDIKSWKVEAVVKCDTSGNATVVAGGTPTELYEDAGMTGPTIAVVGSTAAWDTTIEVTGVAATNITWSASLVYNTAVYY